MMRSIASASRTREQLHALIRRSLAGPDARKAIAAEMRRRVLQTHTYTAITRRMLGFISDDLEKADTAASRLPPLES